MDDNLYNLHKLSVLTCLKNHGNIHLITTQEGAEFLKGIPYTSVEIFDNTIDPFYKRFWAISKILAYKQILSKGEPFIHIDYDVFLFKKLPDRLLNSSVCVQSIENSEGNLEMDLELPKFIYYLKNPYNFCNYDIDYSYNCGLFGGNDLEFMTYYVDEVLKIVNDFENIELFAKDIFRHNVLLSSILEQFYLKILAVKNNIKVSTLFEGTEFDKAVELGYTHLMVSKNSPKVLEAVRKKILLYENSDIL